MDTSQAFGLIDIIVVGGGFYVLYAWYMLMFKGEIKEGILVPKSTSPKRCKDLAGYKAYMGTRTLIFGIVVIISGAVGLYQDYVQKLPVAVYLAALGVFLACVIWFAACSKKAEKLFF